MADRGNSRGPDRKHSSVRYDNRDRNRDRSEGRDNYHRSRREPSRDKDYDRRYSRQDESRRDGGNARYDRREDSYMIEAEAILRVEIMGTVTDILGMIEIKGENDRLEGKARTNDLNVVWLTESRRLWEKRKESRMVGAMRCPR